MTTRSMMTRMPAVVRLVQQLGEVAEGAQPRIDVVEVGDVVAVVAARRGMDRVAATGSRRRAGPGSPAGGSAREVTDAVAVGVLERLHVQAVDDAFCVPALAHGLRVTESAITQMCLACALPRPRGWLPGADGFHFAGALRDAIQARGLGLERIQERLRAEGFSVSLATLSYWQTGRSRPERRESLAALAELEKILGGPAGDPGRPLWGLRARAGGICTRARRHPRWARSGPSRTSSRIWHRAWTPAGTSGLPGSASTTGSMSARSAARSRSSSARCYGPRPTAPTATW